MTSGVAKRLRVMSLTQGRIRYQRNCSGRQSRAKNARSDETEFGEYRSCKSLLSMTRRFIGSS